VEQDTFEEFAADAVPTLLRAAYLYTGGQAAAEDLVQDVLEAVYRAWGRVRDDPYGYARAAGRLLRHPLPVAAVFVYEGRDGDADSWTSELAVLAESSPRPRRRLDSLGSCSRRGATATRLATKPPVVGTSVREASVVVPLVSRFVPEDVDLHGQCAEQLLPV
jgi:hypothetical protein